MSREFPKNPEPQKVAEPTIGRIVYVYGYGVAKEMAAIVTDVVSGLTIHACVFSGNGVPEPAYKLPHISERASVHTPWWDWMPYQKGQAAKTEELERELKQASKLGGE